MNRTIAIALVAVKNPEVIARVGPDPSGPGRLDNHADPRGGW